MPSYVTPKKNTQFIFYIALPSTAAVGAMGSNPTIAAGDFKVSTDGAALANLGTLPVVTPASSKMVKVTLSTSEMNGDNVTVVCSDQTSPPEWGDVVVNIQTSARQIDDLDYIAESYAEVAAAFTWPATKKSIIAWLGAMSRNKRATTAGTDKLRNDADNADLSSSTLSDDGTTFTRGKYS